MRGAGTIRTAGRGEEGQVLPLVAIWIVVLMLIAALVVDMGRVWVAQRQLQTAVDGAALIAGQDLPNSTTAYSAAVSYSGAHGDKNQIGGFGVTPAAPTVTFECVSHAPNYTSGSPPTCPTDSSGSNCQPTGDAQSPQPSGVTTCNAVKVAESATVKTSFAGFVLPSFTVTASATARVGRRPGAPGQRLRDPRQHRLDVPELQQQRDRYQRHPDEVRLRQGGHAGAAAGAVALQREPGHLRLGTEHRATRSQRRRTVRRGRPARVPGDLREPAVGEHP